MGAVRLVGSLLPVIPKTRASKIVFISSMFGTISFPGKTAYASSKSALEAYARALQYEIPELSIITVVPPAMSTQLVERGSHINAKMKEAEIRFMKKRGMNPDLAAKKIIAGIERGRSKIVPGRMTALSLWLARCFPRISVAMTKRFVRKSNFTR